ncbi:hypothetical protein BgiBS90_014763 [Biomphalaria glabrata]|nr:hypothetical protein BgiBS90_014763 [Biomphalaria glabrata]
MTFGSSSTCSTVKQIPRGEHAQPNSSGYRQPSRQHLSSDLAVFLVMKEDDLRGIHAIISEKISSGE